ncbi:hypothetical protein SAMN05421796_11051 [Chryseobacterium piscicola]|uniref:Uncharacterized protein n=1 Tax=Chryseobacterium piscicola TaxID=551459 RepID=A0A1N7P0U8_9FLAO|nr:hypothetical protein [Chryseobacterium piscicola]PQA92764.1 hypothetical protein B0A70_10285 [Chryseobacterium piscicola]SIT04184.1 hypothetical protein SAMN05421796_11051 [Chryseobacterium piscicola]
MQNNKIIEIKNNLPLGGINELIKRTKLSGITINNILKGKPCRMKNMEKVITEGDKIILEYKQLTKSE